MQEHKQLLEIETVPSVTHTLNFGKFVTGQQICDACIKIAKDWGGEYIWETFFRDDHEFRLPGVANKKSTRDFVVMSTTNDGLIHLEKQYVKLVIVWCRWSLPSDSPLERDETMCDLDAKKNGLRTMATAFKKQLTS